MVAVKVTLTLCAAILQVHQGHGYFFAQGNAEGAVGHQQNQVIAGGHHPHHGHGQGGLGMSQNSMFNPFQVFGIHAIPVVPHGAFFPGQSSPEKRHEFYHDCGKTTRFCEYVQRVHIKKNRVHNTQHLAQEQVEETSDKKPQIDYVCSMTTHVCVGNTEDCISTKSCDAALKVTEITAQINEKIHKPVVVSVSHLNNCHMDGQSTINVEKEPQMLFAVGFATYDESGESLECRPPKASDFKLVFLWKNSTVEDSEKANCRPKKEHHRAVDSYDVETMNSVYAWPKVCKTFEKKEGKLDLKAFLTSHTPTAKYTSFFSPPYTFAENFEPQYSSKGMVISGVVSN